MKHRRILAIYLSLALVIGCLGIVPANASQEDNTIDQIPQQNSVAEESPELDTIASVISKENNHVERLYAEEGDNLNTLIFLNENGTKTMYIYDSPVKYRDDQGFVQDISLAIADSDNPSYPFRTQANSVVTEFPAVLSDGIVLSDNDVTLRLVAPPAEGNVALNHKARRLNTQTIAYTYDVKTTIEYGLTYTGFKEDIVVNEYTGQTEYPFILYTNGLELTTIDDSYYLIDDAGDVRASIGDIIVFTADERNNTYGTLQATTIKPGEIYALTIVLDADYLADSNTTYPIRIDPTVELVYTEDTPNAIEEKTLQSNNTTSGSNTATVIGKNAKGISRSIMKFPGLDFDSLRGVNVISAVVTLRDLMCESEEMTITCYPFTGGAWTEANTQWAGLTQSWGAALDFNVVSYSNGVQQATAHRYSFEIKDLAQKWVNGTADESLGIIFRSPDAVENGSEYFYKTFATSERASYKPTFTITFEDVFSLDRGSVDIEEGNSISLTASSVLGSTGEISWISSDPEVATVSPTGSSSARVQGLKAGETTITASCLDVDGKPMSKSCIVYVVVPYGVYYISNISNNRCVTNYDSTINSNSVYMTPKNTSAITQPTQFWEINHLGSGWYSIRPVDRPLGVLTVTNSNNVVIMDLAPNATIHTLNRWRIEHKDYGYVFQHKGLSSAVLSLPTSNTGGTGLTTVAWSSNLNCHWDLSDASGIVLRDSTTLRSIPASTMKYIEKGESLTLDELGFSFFPCGKLKGVSWSSSVDSVVATNTTSGKVSGAGLGQVTITLSANVDSKKYFQTYILTCFNTVNLEVIYDNGYLSKYPQAINRINTHMSALADFYMENFFIQVVYSAPQLFQSYADMCPEPYNESCTCGSCLDSEIFANGTVRLSNSHHKNYMNIAARISFPDVNESFKLAFTGHNVCIKSTSCSRNYLDENPALGITISEVGLVLITHDKSENTEIVTLIHEFGHLLGAPDHYGGDYYPTTEEINVANPNYNFERDCIYGEEYQGNDMDEQTTIKICEGCRKKIQEKATVTDHN